MNKNTHFAVKNLNGTSDPRYALSKSKDGPSWLRIWREHSGSSRKSCCVMNCSNQAQVGAHVIICDGRTSNIWYLAPFCHGCNNHNNTDEMYLDSRVELIPVRPGLR
jgi:hypothetical protein